MNHASSSVKATLRAFSTSTSGLAQAASKQLLNQHGSNTLISTSKGRLLKNFLNPFLSPFVLILLAGGVASLLSGNQNDAIIILVVIMVNAFIEWFQQISAARVLSTLKRYSAKTVKVRRENKVIEIDSTQLVPGDIVLIGQGEKISADGRIISVNDLSVNEASLTGESMPVRKSTETLSKNSPIYQQTNMLFSGTLVLTGRAEMCVTATGNQTELGKIAKLADLGQDKPPIYKKIRKLTLQMIVGTLLLAVLVLLIGLWRGYLVEEMIRFVIALVVSVIPEGLPVTITIVLLLGIKQMAKHKAFVRNLPAIETLGMVTVVATDKTGTLTEGSLEIDAIWDPDGKLSAEDNLDFWLSVSHRHPDLSHPIERLITQETETEGIQHGWKEIDDMPFDNVRRYSAVLWHKDTSYAVYIKGAPEAILGICRLGDNERKKINKQLQSMTSSGMRIIAVAKTVYKQPPAKLSEIKFSQFEFEGFVGFKDELRPGANQAIAVTKEAGIKVLLLTGDHASTAQTIAQDLNLLSKSTAVVEGAQIAEASSQKLTTLLNRFNVFARVLPEHKYKILNSLKQSQITAMTGDGVNDAPALTQADVGIAMGSGTDVAKEAADIVLLDDNYLTIVSAIKAGRKIYANIRKMIFYQLSTNLAEAGTVVMGLLLGLPLPLTAVQILWMNLVTDTTMIIPLGLEKAESNVMKQKPRQPDAPLLSRLLVVRLLVLSVTMSAVSIFTFYLYQPQGLIMAQTMTFLCLCVVQWMSAVNARSETRYSWQTIKIINPALIVGLLLGAFLIGLSIYGPLRSYMGTAEVGVPSLIYLVLPAFITLFVGDSLKFWQSRRVK